VTTLRNDIRHQRYLTEPAATARSATDRWRKTSTCFAPHSSPEFPNAPVCCATDRTMASATHLRDPVLLTASLHASHPARHGVVDLSTTRAQAQSHHIPIYIVTIRLYTLEFEDRPVRRYAWFLKTSVPSHRTSTNSRLTSLHVLVERVLTELVSRRHSALGRPALPTACGSAPPRRACERCSSFVRQIASDRLQRGRRRHVRKRRDPDVLNRHGDARIAVLRPSSLIPNTT